MGSIMVLFELLIRQMIKYFTIAVVVFLYSCRNPSNQTKDTINTALEHNTISSGTTTDTIRNKILGDFSPHVIAIKVNGKYGLYDTLQKKTVTEVKYDYIGSFANENTIDFRVNNKYGYVDPEGNEIVDPTYDHTSGFSDGLASVMANEEWGYINKQGKVVIPIEYEMAWTFKSGLGAVKKDGKWGFINIKGEYILDPIYDNVTRDFDDTLHVANVTVSGQHFFINKKGKRLSDSKPYEKFQIK